MKKTSLFAATYFDFLHLLNRIGYKGDIIQLPILLTNTFFMKNFKILALALVIALPLCFVSCSKDKPGNKGVQETILLSSAKIEIGSLGGGMVVGMKFNYDDNNNITEGYEYLLYTNPTTQQLDTANHNKYVFDRSPSGEVLVKVHYFNSADNKWVVDREKKLIYNGSKLTKLESYNGGTLNYTEVFTWNGDKVTKIYNETSSFASDSAKYTGNNYVDFPPVITEYSNTTAYTKNTSTTESTFGSKSNFLNLIPFEFAMCMNYRDQITPIGEYFSKNALSTIVKTYLNENYEADKVTKRTTSTNITAINYTYTYGSVSSLYPSVVKQAITESYVYVDHQDNAKNTNNENKYETVINLTLIKK